MKPKYETTNIVFLSILAIGMILCAGSIVSIFVFSGYYTNFWGSFFILTNIVAMFLAYIRLRYEFKIFYKTYKMRK